MNISTDTWVFWTWRGVELNATIVFTWPLAEASK